MARMTQHTFRLEPHYAEILDRWATALSATAGRVVTRSEVVRFILEGAARADRKEPEIGDLALLDLISGKGN
jgi:hypothetical protein